jgi:hypothetical protein
MPSPNEADTVFVRRTDGVNNLFEVQPGVLYNNEFTAGMDIRNDSGGALTVMRYEPSQPPGPSAHSAPWSLSL